MPFFSIAKSVATDSISKCARADSSGVADAAASLLSNALR